MLSAHPRSRGEHCPGKRRELAALGSSPLARGTPKFPLFQLVCMRLIPARAGNRRHRVQLRATPPAHPRSRGEHLTIRQLLPVLFGSSPLARGTPSWLQGVQGGTRLIPARAGNTRDLPSSSGSAAAHPRSRGEHLLISGLFQGVRGSSPLARGTLGDPNMSATATRLIPARAGNTSSTANRFFHRKAHPRSRGEHNKVASAGEGVTGSSPLARGTQ